MAMMYVAEKEIYIDGRRTEKLI